MRRRVLLRFDSSAARSDPVRVGDAVPAGRAALAGAAYAPRRLEVAQQGEDLVATGAGLFGERRGGQTVAAGQQLPMRSGARGLRTLFRRLRLFGSGLDSAVEAVRPAPLTISAERADEAQAWSGPRARIRPRSDPDRLGGAARRRLL